jgi:putative ABC transport system permease protein
MRVDLPGDRYRTPRQRSAFFERLEARLGATPGIASATMTSHVPFSSNSGFVQPLAIEGRSLIAGERPPTVSSIYVGAHYFDTLELGLLRGRLFTDTDGTAGHNSAIVNQRFATEFFATGDPIGHRIQLRDGTWFTIVGVSPTVPNLSTIQAASAGLEPVVYLPMRGQPIPASSTRLIVRGGSGFAAVTAQVRETVRTLDADLPLFMVFSMERISTNTTQSLLSVLFGVLAVITLVLDSVVVYAVTAHGVAARTQEIGVRMALGAQEPHVMWLFVRRTLVQLGIGLTIGIGGALALGTLLQAFLVQTGARDSLTLVLVSALLAVVAMMACVLPARRAAQLDPVSALRHE